VALPQDLAAAATLGIESIERNGQHYFRGLSMHSPEVQRQVLETQKDLYRPKEPEGYPTMNIRGGRVEISSVVDSPFGVPFELDVSQFTPLREWRFDPG
jgi:hypothetical protein